jgi:DNA-binding phage protein
MNKLLVIYQKEKEAIVQIIKDLMDEKGYSKAFMMQATQKQRSCLNKALKGDKNMKIETLFMCLGAVGGNFSHLSASPVLSGNIRNLADEQKFVNEHNEKVRKLKKEQAEVK